MAQVTAPVREGEWPPVVEEWVHACSENAGRGTGGRGNAKGGAARSGGVSGGLRYSIARCVKLSYAPVA
ncbi:hypothetical protein GCM10010441_44450 [Kitasatospora paracochleata]